MTRSRTRAAASAVAFFAGACAGSAAAQDVRAAVLAAERELAAATDRSGVGAALEAALARDAVLVWPGAPAARGADARRLLGSLTRLDSLRLAWQPLGLELADDASLAVTWGVAALSSRTQVSPPQLGRYIQTWRREGGGWKVDALLLAGIPALVASSVVSGLRPELAPLAPSGPVGPFVAADLAFARLAGDSGAAIAFERWAAADVTMIDGQGLLVRGRPAVGALVGGPEAWRWHPVAGGAARDGWLAWTVGEAVIAPPTGAPIYSKYLTVWRRFADGSIRFLTDGGNARPAP
jgi:hypothetical protein